MSYNNTRMKKKVARVEFENFSLEKDKNGSFNVVKTLKNPTDHELLLQIAAGVSDLKIRMTEVERIIKLNNLRTK